MPMSAVHNPFQHHSTSPVAIPLVLGASGVHHNKQVFNSIVGTAFKETAQEAAEKAAKEAAQKAAKEAAEKAAKEAAQKAAKQTAKELSQAAMKKAGKEGLGKAGRKLVVSETAEIILKESGGLLTREMAQKMARKEVTKAFVKSSLVKGGKSFAKLGLKYGAIAGVGWMIFKFGNGAVGALGEVLGEAGSDMVQGAAEWMGNNPVLAAAGTGIILFLIGGMVLSMIAPAAATKVAKDKVMGDDKEESSPSEDSSGEGGE